MSLRRCCDRCGKIEPDVSFKKKGTTEIQMYKGSFADENQKRKSTLSSFMDLCDGCDDAVQAIIKDQILGDFQAGESPLTDDPAPKAVTKPALAPVEEKTPEPVSPPKEVEPKDGPAPSLSKKPPRVEKATPPVPTIPRKPGEKLKPGPVKFDALSSNGVAEEQGGIPGDQ